MMTLEHSNESVIHDKSSGPTLLPEMIVNTTSSVVDTTPGLSTVAMLKVGLPGVMQHSCARWHPRGRTDPGSNPKS